MTTIVAIYSHLCTFSQVLRNCANVKSQCDYCKPTLVNLHCSPKFRTYMIKSIFGVMRQVCERVNLVTFRTDVCARRKYLFTKFGHNANGDIYEIVNLGTFSLTFKGEGE